MADLKDSGARREFESGAVRDVQEGKGRCDLLPLDVVARLLNPEANLKKDMVLEAIDLYVRTGNAEELLRAIRAFRHSRGVCMYTLMLEVSKHYEDGARKYEERNWEKGIDLHCFIDSGVRHYLKCLRGDTDEPHDRAFVWNMMCAYWTHIHKPELIDLPFVSAENIFVDKGIVGREEFLAKLEEAQKNFNSKNIKETCFG